MLGGSRKGRSTTRRTLLVVVADDHKVIGEAGHGLPNFTEKSLIYWDTVDVLKQTEREVHKLIFTDDDLGELCSRR